MKNSIEVISAGRPDFPAQLLEIKNPPKNLYYIGNLKCLSDRSISIVGSRTTTVYGRQTAKAIAARLAGRGVVVVSGMAAGIDTSAHIGALEGGGKTVAVLAHGLDKCYPPENSKLKLQIESNGVTISEYPPGTDAIPRFFPYRNRIVSGLSEGTVIVQARNRSGALITAEMAVEQGKEVFAVPGNIDSSYNFGNNKLIQDGATALVSVGDILEYMNLKSASEEEALAELSDTEFEVFKILKNRGEMTVDEVCMALNKPPGFLTPIITIMEMKGFVFCEMGKIFLANR